METFGPDSLNAAEEMIQSIEAQMKIDLQTVLLLFPNLFFIYFTIYYY